MFFHMFGIALPEPPKPIEIGKAYNISEGNRGNGLEVYLCTVVKPRYVYSTSARSRSMNRDPVVLLETPQGAYLVEIDQDLPKRTKNCRLVGGFLYSSDGTKVSRPYNRKVT